jgi:glycosyltransferase involved in cell wall biosynthesis
LSLRVLHLNDHNAVKGGAEAYLRDLFPELEKKGVSSYLLFGLEDDKMWAQAQLVSEISSLTKKDITGVKLRLKQALRFYRPDLVHIHNVQNLGILDFFGSLKPRLPLIMTTHDYRQICPANTFFFKAKQEVCSKKRGDWTCALKTLEGHCVSPRPKYTSYFIRRTQMFAKYQSIISGFVAPSEGAADRFIRAGVSTERLKVIPYFCSLEPLPRPRPIPKKPLALYLGRLAPNKGHEYFVEALGQTPGLNGIMAGGIDEEQAKVLKSLANKWGCADRLELRPWQSKDQIIELLDQATALVFPSLWEETLGIVGIEAASRGVPCVASDLGGVGEWLVDQKNGFRVPPKNAQAISHSLKMLMEDDQLNISMGQYGIDLIRNKFSITRHIDSLLKLYRSSLTLP